MADKLKPCPCGAVPDKLRIAYPSNNNQSRATASGNCCKAWRILYHTQDNYLSTDKCMALAIEAWNLAPRALPISEE